MILGTERFTISSVGPLFPLQLVNRWKHVENVQRVQKRQLDATGHMRKFNVTLAMLSGGAAIQLERTMDDYVEPQRVQKMDRSGQMATFKVTNANLGGRSPLPTDTTPERPQIIPKKQLSIADRLKLDTFEPA